MPKRDPREIHGHLVFRLQAQRQYLREFAMFAVKFPFEAPEQQIARILHEFSACIVDVEQELDGILDSMAEVQSRLEKLESRQIPPGPGWNHAQPSGPPRIGMHRPLR